MRVQVDDARHEREAGGVDRLARRAVDAADLRDPAIPDRDVGGDGGVTAAVVDGRAADQEVVHAGSLAVRRAGVASAANRLP